MNEKKKLSRNQFWLITLIALIVLTLITGSVAVYGMYTKTHSGGTGIQVKVETGAQNQLVTEQYNQGDYNFIDIPAVFPFG